MSKVIQPILYIAVSLLLVSWSKETWSQSTNYADAIIECMREGAQNRDIHSLYEESNFQRAFNEWIFTEGFQNMEEVESAALALNIPLPDLGVIVGGAFSSADNVKDEWHQTYENFKTEAEARYELLRIFSSVVSSSSIYLGDKCMQRIVEMQKSDMANQNPLFTCELSFSGVNDDDDNGELVVRPTQLAVAQQIKADLLILLENATSEASTVTLGHSDIKVGISRNNPFKMVSAVVSARGSKAECFVPARQKYEIFGSIRYIEEVKKKGTKKARVAWTTGGGRHPYSWVKEIDMMIPGEDGELAILATTDSNNAFWPAGREAEAIAIFGPNERPDGQPETTRRVEPACSYGGVADRAEVSLRQSGPPKILINASMAGCGGTPLTMTLDVTIPYVSITREVRVHNFNFRGTEERIFNLLASGEQEAIDATHRPTIADVEYLITVHPLSDDAAGPAIFVTENSPHADLVVHTDRDGIPYLLELQLN